jgi:hypothetical protein
MTESAIRQVLASREPNMSKIAAVFGVGAVRCNTEGERVLTLICAGSDGHNAAPQIPGR